MTFEEWLGDRIETMSSHEYAAEKAAWDAALLQAPEGYVLVPVEPTEKMFWAGDTALNSKPWGNMTSAYKAMIQAVQEEE